MRINFHLMTKKLQFCKRIYMYEYDCIQTADLQSKYCVPAYIADLDCTTIRGDCKNFAVYPFNSRVITLHLAHSVNVILYEMTIRQSKE